MNRDQIRVCVSPTLKQSRSSHTRQEAVTQGLVKAVNVRLHRQHWISSIPLLICNKHRYLRSSVALATHWKEYDCLISTQIKRGVLTAVKLT